ncbi:MAG TPA: 8-amino-7-oxononanoate synthase [Candidatus Hypogeohydataceae bacterium YC38]
MDKLQLIEKELQGLRQEGLYRSLLSVGGVEGPFVKIWGKKYVCFCSNDYLGLAGHPRIKRAAQEAIERYGWGTGASRLVSGNTTVHEALEVELAHFKGTEAALVFPSGYMANVGTVTALVGKGDIVIGDRLNHASLIDGCRLSGADFRVYAHKDTEGLEGILRRSSQYRKRLIVTDGVFSMDGDLAPLPNIVELAKKYKAILMVDDAHGTGVLGKKGKGTVEHYGLERGVDVQMGTLSKALGGIGGFVAGSKTLIEYLKNRSRPFIYTTALPVAACAAAREALKVIEEEPSRREALWRNVRCLKEGLKVQRFKGLKVPEVESPIFPIVIGDAKEAVALSRSLFEKGLWVTAIRPPTVPEGTSRLRVTVTSEHTQEHIQALLSALAKKV